MVGIVIAYLVGVISVVGYLYRCNPDLKWTKKK